MDYIISDAYQNANLYQKIGVCEPITREIIGLVLTVCLSVCLALPNMEMVKKSNSNIDPRN